LNKELKVQECPDAAHKSFSGSATTQRKLLLIQKAGIIKKSYQHNL